jgi:hypothetical protein
VEPGKTDEQAWYKKFVRKEDREMKLRVLKLLIGLSFLTILLAIDSYAATWVYVTSAMDGDSYIDISTIKVNKKTNILTVWCRKEYSSEGKNSKIAGFERGRHLSEISGLIFRELSYAETLFKFDYNKNTFVLMEIAYYSGNGTPLYILHPTSSPPQTVSYVSPESVIELVLNKALESKGIER